MRHIIKKYVEDHWWAFFLQSLVAIGFGIYALFAPQPTEYNFEGSADKLPTLATVVAVALALIGLIEIIRTLFSIKTQRDWGLSLLIGVLETAIGAFMYIYRDSGYAILAFIMGLFLIVRGVFDIIVGLAAHDDSTDRFLWSVSGIAGAVLGVVIINYPNTGTNAFISIFGVYALIFGLSNMIYSIHSRSVVREIEISKEQRKKSRKSSAKTKKSAKSKK
jgi:Uncharacterized conserved protein